MTSPRLTLTLSNQAPTDPWWVRLLQEDVADDSASLADAAVLIDTLYNLDPCDDGTTTATEDPDSDTTDTVVETEIESVACLYDENGDVDVVLQVIRSAIDAEYKLALQGGDLKSVETIRETITLTLVVEDLSSLTLEYPVLGNFSATWRGAVYGSTGVISPQIKRCGNTLDFGATVKAGTISATFTTEYDRCTVTVLGDNGQPGACTARVFYHGLVEELELELPEASEEIGSCQVRWTVPQERDQIECYRTVYVSQRCQCSPDELDFYTYEEVVSCPDSVIRCPGVLNECRHYLGTVVAHEYVECASDMVEAVSHPAYYKKMCCQEPSVTLPQCKEQKTSWRGGLPIKGGAQQYYDLYGKDLEIIPVGPPGGVCGEWTKKQEIIGNACCGGVPELEWDASVSPEVMAPDSVAVIAVNGGGTYPYQWTVSGTGFWFENGAKSIETSGNQVRLIAASGSCGSALITVTDGCTTCAGEVRSTAGSWVLVHEGEGGYPGTPPAMMPGTDVRPPFTQHWREGVKGRWKIRQLFLAGCQCYAQCYALRSNYADAIAFCAANTSLSACATLVDWSSKGYFTGSLFADTRRCEECGDCTIEMPDNSYFSYSLGAHSEIYWSVSMGLWVAYVGHTAIIQTEVYEWRC